MGCDSIHGRPGSVPVRRLNALNRTFAIVKECLMAGSSLGGQNDFASAGAIGTLNGYFPWHRFPLQKNLWQKQSPCATNSVQVQQISKKAVDHSFSIFVRGKNTPGISDGENRQALSCVTRTNYCFQGLRSIGVAIIGQKQQLLVLATMPDFFVRVGRDKANVIERHILNLEVGPEVNP